jgi:hypothetical protein
MIGIHFGLVEDTLTYGAQSYQAKENLSIHSALRGKLALIIQYFLMIATFKAPHVYPKARSAKAEIKQGIKRDPKISSPMQYHSC